MLDRYKTEAAVLISGNHAQKPTEDITEGPLPEALHIVPPHRKQMLLTSNTYSSLFAHFAPGDALAHLRPAWKACWKNYQWKTVRFPARWKACEQATRKAHLILC